MGAPENPPAFPQSMAATPAGDVYWSGQAFPGADGMTLRDWFAGQVASGMAAYSGTMGAVYGPGDIAERSYEIADTMLAARKGGDK